MTIDEQIYLPDVSSYKYSQIKEYNQYAGASGLQDFMGAVNLEIKANLQKFFSEFKNCINLRSAVELTDNFDRSYTEFYLIKYFGLTKIPDPNDKESSTKTVMDMGALYDDGEKYDELVDSKDVSAFIKPREWALICLALLNYSFPVINLDYVFNLIKLFYYSNTDEEFDLTQVRVELGYDAQTSQRYTKIILPNDATGNDIWSRFIAIVEYNPTLLGLPLGRKILFGIG